METLWNTYKILSRTWKQGQKYYVINYLLIYALLSFNNECFNILTFIVVNKRVHLDDIFSFLLPKNLCLWQLLVKVIKYISNAWFLKVWDGVILTWLYVWCHIILYLCAICIYQCNNVHLLGMLPLQVWIILIFLQKNCTILVLLNHLSCISR